MRKDMKLRHWVCGGDGRNTGSCGAGLRREKRCLPTSTRQFCSVQWVSLHFYFRLRFAPSPHLMSYQGHVSHFVVDHCIKQIWNDKPSVKSFFGGGQWASLLWWEAIYTWASNCVKLHKGKYFGGRVSISTEKEHLLQTAIQLVHCSILKKNYITIQHWWEGEEHLKGILKRPLLSLSW